MLLIVGQILRAHGIRGEVVVDVRTDEPEERFAVGSVLVTDSTAVRRLAPVPDGAWQVPPQLTIEAVRPHQGRLLVVFDGVYDRDLAEELRGVLLCVDSADVAAESTIRTSSTTTSWSGWPWSTPAARRSARWSASTTRPRPTCWSCAGRTGVPRWCPFVKAIVPEVDLAAGRVVLTPARGPARPLMRVDIVTIFPEYLAPLELSLHRQGAGHRAAPDRRARPADAGPHDVHRTVDDTPYGGGPGMVMRPEPWGQALDALADRHGPADRAEPGRGAVHPGARARVRGRGAPDLRLRPVRGHRPAGRSTTPPPGCR